MREVVGRDPLVRDLGSWEVVLGCVFQQCYFCQLTSQLGHDSLVEQEVDLRMGDFRSRGVRTCISSHRSLFSAQSSLQSQVDSPGAAINLSRFLTENSSDPQNKILNRSPHAEGDVLNPRLDRCLHVDILCMINMYAYGYA